MIDLRPIDTLIPYARNSRTHSPESVEGLAASIDEFGLAGSIIIRDGTIAAGHGTLQAVRRLIDAGKAVYPVPGRKASPAPPPFDPGMVPVTDASGWSEAQFRAFVIAHNRHALNAGWDDELLKIEFEELAGLGFDLDLTGWKEGEIAEIQFLAVAASLSSPVEELMAPSQEKEPPKVKACPHCGGAI